MDKKSLRALIDGREQIRKSVIRTENQLRAAKKNDNLLPETIEWLKQTHDNSREELKKYTKHLSKVISENRSSIPFIDAGMDVRGVGPVTIAYLYAYLDPYKAEHPSSFWKYCGYHCSATDRYKKGVKGGGSKTMRTILYNFGSTQIRQKGAYIDIYNQAKAHYESSDKIVKTYKKGGQLVELPWKEVSSAHRHMASMRKMIKHFLADAHIVWRDLENLPISKPYPIEHCEGNHNYIHPVERGWYYYPTHTI